MITAAIATTARSAPFNSGTLGTINANSTGIENDRAAASAPTGQQRGRSTAGGVLRNGIYNYGSETGGHLSGGTIGTLTVGGLISANDNAGINNEGFIGTLNNDGTIIRPTATASIIYGRTSAGHLTSGGIGTLSNTGLIESEGVAIGNNGGSIGLLTNSGTIVSHRTAMASSIAAATTNRTLTGGFIGVLANSGTITSRRHRHLQQLWLDRLAEQQRRHRQHRWR